MVALIWMGLSQVQQNSPLAAGTVLSVCASVSRFSALEYLLVEALWDFDGSEPDQVSIKDGEYATHHIDPLLFVVAVVAYQHDLRRQVAT